VEGERRLEARLEGFDWAAARALAAEGTRLVAGDLLVSPALGAVGGLEPGSVVELELEGIGVLEQRVAA
jgi:2-keto-4-pentenoate hydratase/2-oxohepta-3-ene-1,7-dioic acid hydratase in catechol pathway